MTIETKINQENDIKPHIKVFDLQPKSKKSFFAYFSFLYRSIVVLHDTQNKVSDYHKHFFIYVHVYI